VESKQKAPRRDLMEQRKHKRLPKLRKLARERRAL
jgi:hypothetical protein